MRKYILLVGSAMVFCLSSLTYADTKTDDSTNTYTPSDQHVEKLHQKPVAEDANSGADESTTANQSESQRKTKVKKQKMMDKKHKTTNTTE
jgi:hypothetical protein